MFSEHLYSIFSKNANISILNAANGIVSRIQVKENIAVLSPKERLPKRFAFKVLSTCKKKDETMSFIS